MRKVKVIVSLVAATSLLAAMSGTALAEHPHWLSTPGTCVEDMGSGQTSISDTSHGGYHRFHENVHLGVPGAKAFANEKNPVSVGKVDPDPCP